VIEVEGVSKVLRGRRILDRVSFAVKPGLVTGFLGPNGAGKTTTLRIILGLQAPTGGGVKVYGRRLRDYDDPLRQIGALLDSDAIDRRRTAYMHLRAVAATHGIPDARVEEVLDLTGLSAAAFTTIRQFSLGMRQRLGLARALLGDPRALVLDEPVNGLDPEGIVWIRGLLRGFARQGRPVLVSSHLMSEMALTVDHLIVLGRGRVLADAALREFVSDPGVEIRVNDLPTLARALREAHATVSVDADRTRAVVHGRSLEDVGEIASRAGVVVYELRARARTLEDAYFELTESAVEHRSKGPIRASI
jgi:ABC-2 type transport system ATP-binding protein